MQRPNKPEKSSITNVSGAIISFRIREFLSLSYSAQTKIIQQMQQIFANLLEITVQGDKLSWQWINHLDGSFTFFLEDSSDELSSSTQLFVCLAFAIGLKFYERKKEWPYTFTIALHWDDDVQVVRNRILLQTINSQKLFVAHHIVSFVECSPILIAKEAFEKMDSPLFGEQLSDSCEHLVSILKQAVGNDLSFVFPPLKASYTLDASDRYYLQPIALQDYQHRETQWYTFAIDGVSKASKVGDLALPMEQMSIIYNPIQYLTQQTDVILSDLIKHLVWSDEIVLIGITHHLLPGALTQAIQERHAFWRMIQIVFPNRNNIQRLIDEHQIPEERLSEWEASRVNVQRILENGAPEDLHQWECLECIQDLSFVGSRYTHNGQTYIRFAPLLLGSDPRYTMHITIGSNTTLFAQISHTIDDMVLHRAKVLHDSKIQRTAPLTEWDILGQHDQGMIRYRGVFNRANLASVQLLEGLTFPVVLIVLYVEAWEGTHVVLQERTTWNATSDIGTYSNISGRLCTDDVVSLYPDRFWVNSSTNDIAATKAFNDFSNLSEGSVLDEGIWRQAAVRELHEELGLNITPERLEKRASCHLERKDGNLFFHIYSLKLRQELQIDELLLIHQKRPSAALRQFRKSELRQLYDQNKFNRLLQARYAELFLPLFEQINIAP